MNFAKFSRIAILKNTFEGGFSLYSPRFSEKRQFWLEWEDIQCFVLFWSYTYLLWNQWKPVNISRRNFNQTVYCNTTTTRYWSLKLFSICSVISLKKVLQAIYWLINTNCEAFEELQKVRICGKKTCSQNFKYFQKVQTVGLELYQKWIKLSTFPWKFLFLH